VEPQKNARQEQQPTFTIVHKKSNTFEGEKDEEESFGICCSGHCHGQSKSKMPAVHASCSLSLTLIAFALFGCGSLLRVQEARHPFNHLVRSGSVVNDVESMSPAAVAAAIEKVIVSDQGNTTAVSLQEDHRELQSAPPKQLVVRVRLADKPTSYKLGRCEGDCNTDSDCQPGLRCKERKVGEEVPGCVAAGNVNPRADFCYDPTPSSGGGGTGTEGGESSEGSVGSSSGGGSSGSTSSQGNGPGFNPNNIHNPNPPRDRWVVNPKEWRPHNFPIRMTFGDKFKLHLYWDHGVWWQEENFDRRWCLRCRRGCYPGNGLMIVHCDQNQSGEQIPNLWSFDSTSSANAYMIKVDGGNACLSRLALMPLSQQNLELQSCDENDSKQHWVATSGSFTRGQAFQVRMTPDDFLSRGGGDCCFYEEKSHVLSNTSRPSLIVQISPADNLAYCITQRHHPRYGETVDIEPCATAKKSHTENWNMY